MGVPTDRDHNIPGRDHPSLHLTPLDHDKKGQSAAGSGFPGNNQSQDAEGERQIHTETGIPNEEAFLQRRRDRIL